VLSHSVQELEGGFSARRAFLVPVHDAKVFKLAL
jgi:hypothetical protein